MKLPRSFRPRLAVARFLLVGSSLISLPAFATTYYVSAGGSDSNTGTDTAHPWLTCAKVNGQSFSPGDTILFHRGDVWSMPVTSPRPSYLLSPGFTAASPHPSGTAAAPIVIDAYGDGTDLPLLQGQSNSTAVVLLNNQQHWQIRHLEVTNSNASVTFPAHANRTDGIDVYFDNTQGAVTYSGILISGCYVHAVDGLLSGTQNTDFKRNGAIMVHAEPWTSYSGQAAATVPPLVYFDDINIRDNVIEDVNGTGIGVNNWFNGSFPLGSRNSGITNCTVNNNIVRRASGDGIVVRGATGPRLTHNIIYDTGYYAVVGNNPDYEVACWTGVSSDAICAYNEVARTRQFNANGDGTAFDSDGSSSGTHIYEYNYTHDNDGALLLRPQHSQDQATEPTPNIVIRYNLSVNDGQGGSVGVSPVLTRYGNPNYIYYTSTTNGWGPALEQSISIYNNVFYQTTGCLSPLGNSSKYQFSNNIFSFGTAPTWGTNPVYSHNAYDRGLAAPSTDANAQATSDVKFVSPGGDLDGRDNTAGYRLQSTSVCLGHGTAITANGGLDYFGNVVPSGTPDIGMQAVSGASSFVHDWHLDGTTADAVGGSSLSLSSAGASFSSSSPRLGSSDLLLDGVHGYATNSSLSDPGAAGYTVSLWVRRSSTGTLTYSPFLAAKGNVFSSTAGWSLFLGSTTGVATARVSDGTNLASTASLPLNDTNWHHLAMVVDPIAGRVMGSLDGLTNSWSPGSAGPTSDSLVNFGAISSTDKFSLGDVFLSGADQAKYFAGDLDESRIYAAALGEQQVQMLAYPELLGWWPLNNYAGDITANGSGTFTLVNTPTFTNLMASPPHQGNTFALTFAGGSSQYAYDSAIPDPGTGSFSVSLWFKRSSASAPTATNVIADKGNIFSTNAGWSIYLSQTTGVLTVRCNSGGGSTARAGETGPAILDTGWHHVVMVIDRSAGVIHGYLDGSNSGWTSGGGGATSNSLSAFGGSAISAAENTAVGAVLQGSTPSAYFSGSVDDLRVLTRALAPADVLHLAQP